MKLQHHKHALPSILLPRCVYSQFRLLKQENVSFHWCLQLAWLVLTGHRASDPLIVPFVWLTLVVTVQVGCGLSFLYVTWLPFNTFQRLWNQYLMLTFMFAQWRAVNHLMVEVCSWSVHFILTSFLAIVDFLERAKYSFSSIILCCSWSEKVWNSAGVISFLQNRFSCGLKRIPDTVKILIKSNLCS